MGRFATVFQAEVYAIYQAASNLIGLEGQCITIYSDSRAALLALNSKEVKSMQVQNTIGSLNELSQHNSVCLKWIKAHVGHEGNELADELAKAGCRVETLAPNVPLVTKNHIREELRKCVVKEWNRHWRNIAPCRQTKLFIPSINKSQATDICSRKRREVSALTQLISGHNRLRRHNALVDLGMSNLEVAKCRFCEEAEETTYHIISECDKFARLRMEIFKDPYPAPPFKFKSHKLIQFLKESGIEEFTEIIGQANPDDD